MSRGFSRVAVLAGLMSLAAARVHAEGEAVNGFPNWSERVLLEWMNRARADPQTELAACPGGNCAENINSCYVPQPPRVWNANIAHSARYHSDEMVHNVYFDHWSECTVVPTIATKYLSQPQQCNGSASCGCAEHMISGISQTGTDPFARMALFSGGVGSAGEIIAEDGQGPDATFYLWLYEPAASNTCTDYSDPNPPYHTNGHRWLILTSQYGASSSGPGVSGALSTVDFDDSTGSSPKIPSGSHYPQQAASVDAWVSWHASAGPSAHTIDVDGVCSKMTLSRGSPTNGAWHALVSGVGSGCHRYVFAFKDSGGNNVLYPTTGSLAIGNGGAQCPDWSATAPAACVDLIFANGFEP